MDFVVGVALALAAIALMVFAYRRGRRGGWEVPAALAFIVSVVAIVMLWSVRHGS